MSELYHPRHMSPALWSIAGIVAIALHAGGVGLAFMSKQPDSEPDLGAPAIEIGIALAAPKLDPTDLPVGPDTRPRRRRPRAFRLLLLGAHAWPPPFGLRQAFSPSAPP